jgi:hypothetical protein
MEIIHKRNNGVGRNATATISKNFSGRDKEYTLKLNDQAKNQNYFS